MRKYYTLDVFTNAALGGNPLAVVMDSEGLNTERMQAIAGEFNLSETVFVAPAKDKMSRAELRIFTPKNELPFAGHPTVGTAVLLAALDGLEERGETDFILVEKVGPVKCHVSRTGELATASFALPTLPKRQEIKFDRGLLALALGIEENQLGMDGHSNAVCDAGVPFPVVALTDLSAMEAIQINEPALEKCFQSLGFALELYVYCKQCVGADVDYHVRLFAPAMGIAEDPATGSAAAAFAAQIMACDRPGDGRHIFVIEQGIEMGRPSRIELVMEVEGGALCSASIGGQAIMISDGQLHL